MVGYKVIDNFLPEDMFSYINSELSSNMLPWKWHPTVEFAPAESDHWYMSALFYDRNILHESFQIFSGLIEKLEIKACIRVKLNLYTRTENLIHHQDHTDYPFSHKGALFSLNTCDGFTVIDGVEIPSVANRMIFFDPSILHHSTNCTNVPGRMNINFNYF
tara:strand:- start:75 stop:557 length:483 start_codon:yes stop_codon:yes gene_type:complete